MGQSVSIIIPFYNAANFLKETIECVLHQSVDDYELLLCDDGSTDGSSSTAKQYAAHYPDKIGYLQHPDHLNHGQFSTRILGAKHARGSVLALLDADDLWDGDYLEKHIKIWQSVVAQGVYLSYGPSLYWFYEDSTGSDNFVQPLPPGTPKIFAPGQLLDAFLNSAYGVTPCPSCTFIRREVFMQLTQFESIAKETMAFEDQILWWYTAARWSIAVHSEPWVKYRQHKKSSVATTGRYRKAQEAELKFLKAIYDDLQNVYPKHPLICSGKLIAHIKSLEKLSVFRMKLRYFLQNNLSPNNYTKIRNLYHRLKNVLKSWYKMPIVRNVRCMQFRRLKPFHEGKSFGTPVVRYYWERYLTTYQEDIKGYALEIGTTDTVKKFGGKRVTKVDAIDIVAHSSEISVVADLCKADHIDSNKYDCFINQFTTQFIYNVESALYHSIRILKPGGVLLINFPCIDYYFPEGLDMSTGTILYMYNWFTPIQVEDLLRRSGLVYGDYDIEIVGNLFTCIAYQLNMPAEELTSRELKYVDSGHPLLICGRIKKPVNWNSEMPEYKEPYVKEGTPVRWNPDTLHYPSH